LIAAAALIDVILYRKMVRISNVDGDLVVAERTFSELLKKVK